MGKILFRLIMALMLCSTTISAQWTDLGAFPDENFIGSTTGIAVDPDGKVWWTSYYKSIPWVQGADTVMTNGIRVFNADGTEADFSPIVTVATGGGFVVDTLISASGGRGLAADQDGNIIYVQSSTNKMFKIDYKTGLGLARHNITEIGSSPTRPGISDNGTIFVGPVVGGRSTQIAMYNTDLEYIGSAVDAPPAISRCLEVSQDGNTIYWTPFTGNAMYIYKRADDLSRFELADSALIGISIETVRINPATGYLWVSSDSRKTAYTSTKWFAFDTVNKTLVDSFTYTPKVPDASDILPRGLDFTDDGMTAYVGTFSKVQYGITKFIMSAYVPIKIDMFTAPNGETITVPIMVGDLTGKEVLSYQFDLHYNPLILEAQEIETANSITPSGWFALGNPDNVNGKISVAASGATSASGSGILVNVKFKVIGASGSSTLGLTDFLFNTGDPIAVVTNGGFAVTTVSDSLAVSVGSHDGIEGETITVPIMVGDLTGKEVLSYQFDLHYNPLILEALEIETANSITPSGWFALGNPDNVNGKISVAASGATSASGSGTLVNVKFKVINASGSSTLGLTDFVFNTGDPVAVVTNGSFMVTTVTQNFSLKAGWNLISLNVTPDTTTPQSIFSSIKNILSEVKGITGSYSPAVPDFLNTLHNLQDGLAYWVKVSEDVALEVAGTPIDYSSLQISLKAGWNLAGYPVNRENVIQNALNTIWSQLEQAKDLRYSFNPSVPDFLNTLKVLSQNNGYWIKVKSDVLLTYPTPTLMPKSNNMKEDIIYDKWEPIYYTNSEVVYIELEVNNSHVASGIVSAFIDGECRGIGNVVSNEEKSYTTIVVNGEENSEMIFKYYDSLLEEEIQIKAKYDFIPGNSSTKVILLKGYTNEYSKSLISTTTKLYYAYPNPFNPSTEIKFDLNKNSNLKLSVYNMKGELVKIITSGEFSAGSYSYKWNGNDRNHSKVSSGVYIIQLSTDEKTESNKVVLLK